ncbi:MAG: CRISPR-associated protein Cas4, partial [Desulfotomaculum sp.]|nr:CRISPR-associated protein Cas4 [Desulfotomaculum sp.]
MKKLKGNDEQQYLPISAVAEILYCPRNFYYRVLEGAEEQNAHVLEGKLQEERRNERASVKREDYHQVRSIKISSDRLKLVGIMDAVEEGTDIYPVEYKKGDLAENINDDVQLCAQAMVLEEKLGRDIDRGYIYYVKSRARREVIFDQQLREMVLNTIDRGFEIIHSGEIPAPIADNRCDGCALNSRCLPFEVNYLTGSNEQREVRPVPSYNLGRVLYVDEQGAYLRKKGERVLVTKDDTEVMDIPLCNIEQVVLVGTVNISAPLIKLFLKRGTEVHFLTKGGRYNGSLQPPLGKNSVLRIVQHKAFQDEEYRLKLAKEFVRGKLANMRTLLRRHNQDKQHDELAR